MNGMNNAGNDRRSEREKMIAGELYVSADPELTAARARTRDLLARFNQSAEGKPEERLAILKELLGRVEGRIEITPPFYCDYGTNIEVGDNFYTNFNCVILDCAPVKIGKNVMLAPGVQIYTAYHPLDAVERASGRELAAAITIGDDVWIGGMAIINPGVTIGARSVIGAGSVVTRDIPPGVVAAGNPCRVIRTIEGGPVQA